MWFETTGAILAYLGIGGTFYRYRYVSTYKDFLKWQAEDPDANTWMRYEYGATEQPRSRFRYSDYMQHVNLRVPPGWLGVLWPFIGTYFALKKVLRPEIEAPDYAKINRLEKDLNELVGTDPEL